MNLDTKLRSELATGLDFKLLEDDSLNKAIATWETLRDDGYDVLDDMPTLQGDVCQILQDRKDDPANVMIEAIGMCLKFPGRRTWIMSSGEEMGMDATYWFAVDTVEAAIKIVEENCTRVRAEVEAAKQE